VGLFFIQTADPSKLLGSWLVEFRGEATDDLEKVRDRLASLAWRYHADYFACDKSAGDIVARTYFLPVKSNAPRFKA
jgi:hypothetical protein